MDSHSNMSGFISNISRTKEEKAATALHTAYAYARNHLLMLPR